MKDRRAKSFTSKESIKSDSHFSLASSGMALHFALHDALEVLACFPFTSETKRMGILVEDEEIEEIKVAEEVAAIKAKDTIE